jgi:hypothetical protein
MNLPLAAAWVRNGADASAETAGRRKVASIPTNVRALRSEDECTDIYLRRQALDSESFGLHTAASLTVLTCGCTVNHEPTPPLNQQLDARNYRQSSETFIANEPSSATYLPVGTVNYPE